MIDIMDEKDKKAAPASPEEDPLIRTRMLIGDVAVEKLARARVAVFGVGGVGGYAVEALARAGVGALDLIDADTVALSNLNRQIVATRDTLGMPKVEAAKARILSIRPDCTVRTHAVFYLPETAGSFDFSSYDYIVDAVDTVAAKLSLVEEAKKCGTPIISAMGAGNKLDPAAFRVADISATAVCPLARVMRLELRKRGIRRLKVVYSEEIPKKPQGAPDPTKGRVPPGSISFVPPVVGLMLAGEVVKDLIKED